MQIVCPHCDTHYDVRDEALAPAGRTVRCARCKETWLALPETAAAAAGSGGLNAIDRTADDSGFPFPVTVPQDDPAFDPVHIDSPPIAAEMPAATDEGPAPAIDVASDAIEPIATPLRRRRPPAKKAPLGPTAIMAMLGALCLAIIAWRTDIVRLMPQTAPFFRTFGLGVNLRALDFTGLKTSTETVNGITILVIEGDVVARQPVEVPRLRFGLNDAAGKEIHAWNATIEQASLGKGEGAGFVSRLAAPPADAREITVRFFNKRDIASGGK